MKYRLKANDGSVIDDESVVELHHTGWTDADGVGATTPTIESRERAKPMKDKFTAFSISSILMKITITLRRRITPRTPIKKSNALNNKI